MRLVVKKSKIRGAGLGLFANMDFPADAVLGEYWGVRTTTKPADGRYTWRVDTDDGPVYIDAAQNDCPLRFVNGAKTERQHERINCKTYTSHGALLYVTTRAVKAGEELIVDYGPYYWACDCERCRPNRKNSRSTSRKISRVANRGDRINVAFATIDLFAGVGGFSLGAAAAGARVILAVEACPKIAALHTLNLPHIPIAIEELGRQPPAIFANKLRKLHKLAGGGHLHLHGSPPCQSLSVANKMTGSTKKGLRLVRWFLDVVESLDPSSWSMEQVPNKKLLHLLTTRGVPFHVVNAADHSVPQSRKRVIAGSKIVVEAMKKAAGTGPTVLPKDVLTNLQPSRHSLQNGTENESVHRDGKYVGLRTKRADEGLRSLNEPAHTVWSKPGRVVEKNRVVRLLTPAEMARLQGFPANFKLDEKSLTRSRLVVGNALPPPLAFNIMRAAMKTL